MTELLPKNLIAQYRPMAAAARAWPFQEAERLLKRYATCPPPTGKIIFQTGYGPSGLPHMGTFGEVLRTNMVRQALAIRSDYPSTLICFSDDMDGLRKIPDNIPNPELLRPYLGQPLTSVPNPYTTGPYSSYQSFGEQNNARLKDFLDSFNFDYEFVSATETYRAGFFDEYLKKFLIHHQAILDIMLPTLGSERQSSYSPFLPLCPDTGQVLQVPILEIDTNNWTILYQHPNGKKITTSVLGGHCKLQWKPDWAMRQMALHVDYEMSGKDLIPSAELASEIIKTLKAKPPEVFHYELFLDELGQKISKSKGNGLALEDWLTYAPQNSVSYFMYQKPKTAKRLYFDIIPKQVDEYFQQLASIQKNPEAFAEHLENPVFHIAPKNFLTLPTPAIGFSLLLHLVSAADASEKSVLWGFIQNYHADLTPAKDPALDDLVGYALVYYEDFVKPKKSFKQPNPKEKSWLQELANRITHATAQTPAEWQNLIYDMGKTTELELKQWFQLLYQTLLGQDDGPRLGSFITLFGKDRFLKLITKAIT